MEKILHFLEGILIGAYESLKNLELISYPFQLLHKVVSKKNLISILISKKERKKIKPIPVKKFWVGINKVEISTINLSKCKASKKKKKKIIVIFFSVR